ncbi:MAG: lamin tail domain-containing protein [archaeon]|nr:lamin tail domain-containing protein [archaeon]
MNSPKILVAALTCLFLLFGSVSAAIVINEFEENPGGSQSDSGREWVELYNMGPGDVYISGWKLIESYNMKEVMIPSDVTILSGGYHTITWTNGSLINTKPLNITLYDDTGFEIDKTRTISDSPNDDRCWARIPNGYDTDNDDDWDFVNETKGKNNDGTTDPIPEFPTFILPVLLMFASLSLARKHMPPGL